MNVGQEQGGGEQRPVWEMKEEVEGTPNKAPWPTGMKTKMQHFPSRTYLSQQSLEQARSVFFCSMEKNVHIM